MPNIFEVDYENVLVDTMLQHREKFAPVSLYIDCERDAVEATKYLMRRLGINVDAASMSEEEKSEVRRQTLAFKDIYITHIQSTTKTMLKLKETHARVAIYARVSMRDPQTAEFLKVASAADHLVIVTV